ncbi:DUF1488 family protein [Sphingomonas faeni]|uniref:DUF1488 family protein n=1 Tax=Sphingomonas faeni TaxID=185950 RepID=UPI00335CFB6B
MAEDRLDIDTGTIEVDDDLRRIEFEAEISSERYRFAVHYDVLEALSAMAPDAEAATIFRQHADEIARLGAKALARDPDQEIIVISENDLD